MLCHVSDLTEQTHTCLLHKNLTALIQTRAQQACQSGQFTDCLMHCCPRTDSTVTDNTDSTSKLLASVVRSDSDVCLLTIVLRQTWTLQNAQNTELTTFRSDDFFRRWASLQHFYLWKRHVFPWKSRPSSMQLQRRSKVPRWLSQTVFFDIGIAYSQIKGDKSPILS